MTQNESLHDMRMVSSNHWPSFFADLAQKYGNQTVSIEVDEDLLADNPPTAQVPLSGIKYDKHKGIVVSTETQPYTVKALDLVWAIHDEDGELVGVEIIAQDGGNLILRLEP